MPAISRIQLHDPAWLIALVPLALLVWWRYRHATALVVPFAAAWYAGRQHYWQNRSQQLIIAAAVCFIIALARPQVLRREEVQVPVGCDVMLAIDMSRSMAMRDALIEGGTLGRWDAARPAIERFIEARKADRIGLVVFAGKAFTVCGPSESHVWVNRQLRRLNPGFLGDGTSIGDGVALAVMALDRLGKPKSGPPPPRFVVVVSDGASNCGILSPHDAIEFARKKAVQVYTVVASTHPHETITFFGEGKIRAWRTPQIETDEALLWRLALDTGGKFYRAGSAASFNEALIKVHAAHQQWKNVIKYTPREFFHLPAALAFLMILAGLTLNVVLDWFAKRRAWPVSERLHAPVAGPRA